MKFFNRFNRDNHFVMMHLWHVVDKWLKDKGCQLTKTENEDLGKAGKLIDGVSQRLFKRLDKEYSEKVIRDLETTMIVIQRATQNTDEINVVKRASTDYLGEIALVFCNSHLREGCIKYKKCKMYQALSDAGVPVCVLESNACPYRGERYEKKTNTWTKVVEIPEIKLPYKQNFCKSCGKLWTAETEEQERNECPKCGGKLGEWR